MFFFVHDISGAKYMRQGNRFTTDAGYEKRIAAKSSRFEFVGGEPESNFVYIMCKDCLGVIKKSKESLKPSRSKALLCPHCQKVINDARRKKKQERREQNKIKKQKLAEIKAIEEKEAERIREIRSRHICKRCGQRFSGRPNRTYCSPLCARRAYDSKAEHTRRTRMKTKSENVSLDLLLKRDKGICWICKLKVNQNDYFIRPDGTFIAGNNYPSIDHVVALKNGGTHTWNNVKLAHRICNTRKHAKMFYEDKSGQISLFI